ncbi:hypothetical protein [Alteromonas halophila]|uniref:KfrA N-terminal DNA-binding domain-containing protein n=1 Tax=Alteromonas halophila TaxID=516698 RepID=A0A918MU86_9ALTE|nr:hypothetical protein [Alteromonas halophila]GGW73041.1 hypothetical protein GCM10007391_00720 [Alteromonas halophila]
MQQREELQRICREIAEQGLTPGVGLLRARAPFKLSVAEAIEALKHFKMGTARSSRQTPDDQAKSEQTMEERMAALEARVAHLEAQLASK